MKNIFFGLFLLLFIAQGCVKDNNECNATDATVVPPASEIANVQTYLTNNGISATQHPNGFFYSVTNVGTGTAISNLCSIITVAYKGKLTNGNTFDSTSVGQSVKFELQQVIVGWQKGIPLINKGGTMKLYLPPSLGYGTREIRDNSGNLLIPSNSILIFDVELLNVENL